MCIKINIYNNYIYIYIHIYKKNINKKNINNNNYIYIYIHTFAIMTNLAYRTKHMAIGKMFLSALYANFAYVLND